jgi:hypothetical protein
MLDRRRALACPGSPAALGGAGVAAGEGAAWPFFGWRLRRARRGADDAAPWFVKRGATETGPMALRHLQGLIDFGLLAPADLVRQGENGAWTPLRKTAVFKRLRWPAKSVNTESSPSPKPKEAVAEAASVPPPPDGEPTPAQEKISDAMHRGAVLVERCRVVLRGSALALIALGGYEAAYALRVWVFPFSADSPFFGLGFGFAFLGIAAFWVTYDGAEKY